MTAIEYLEAKIAQEASKRTRRQLSAVKKWILTNCQGTIEWPTGVGKTRIATEAVGVMRRVEAARSYLVVVPTIQLKEQWEEGLTSLGMMGNGQVVVINGLVRSKTPITIELLILDEIHRYAAKDFFKVFDVVKYEYILGLTATLKRLDKKHKLLEEKAPIIDRMSLLEARRDKYLALFREYNLGIEMTQEQREAYRELAKMYGYNMDKFHQDFDLMRRCSMGIKPWKVGEGVWRMPTVVEYASRLGWRGNSPIEAAHLMALNESSPRGQKGRDLWGNDTHPYCPQRLYVQAINGMRAIREIKEFIHANMSKRDATVELITRFNRKTIVFGETISRAEEIHALLPDITVLYHSKMTKKEKDKSMLQVMSNPDILAILTARALDQGFDWPQVQLGIIESRTSSTTQQTQRRGRVVRLHTFVDGTEKEGVIINVYLKDTKDYDWLNKAQVGSGPSKWVDSLEEILRAEGLVETISI